MKRVSPQHRLESVRVAVKQATPPENPVERSLYCVLMGEAGADPDVVYAYELFNNEEHRAILNAFFLSGAPPDVTSRVLGIPVRVLAAYQFLFFDVDTFRNRLEKISYAAECDASAYAKELLRTGVMVGAEYLIWTYGGRGEVDTRQVVRHTMVDSFFRGMAHKGNSLTSGVTKESQKWWATAIRNAEILERIDPRATKQAYEELRIALDGADDTVSVEKAPVPLEDILH